MLDSAAVVVSRGLWVCILFWIHVYRKHHALWNFYCPLVCSWSILYVLLSLGQSPVQAYWGIGVGLEYALLCNWHISCFCWNTTCMYGVWYNNVCKKLMTTFFIYLPFIWYSGWLNFVLSALTLRELALAAGQYFIPCNEANNISIIATSAVRPTQLLL